MKHGDARLGVAWQEPVKDAPDRKKFSLALSLGVIGPLACRIVENPKRENPRAPTHLIFHTPIDGEDRRVGALWPGKSERTGAEYLAGNVDLHALGVLDLRGGVKVDFRRVGDRLPVRLSKNEGAKTDRSPSHILWRMKPVPRDKRATTGASVPETTTIPDAGDELSGEMDDLEEEEVDLLS